MWDIKIDNLQNILLKNNLFINKRDMKEQALIYICLNLISLCMWLLWLRIKLWKEKFNKISKTLKIF